MLDLFVNKSKVTLITSDNLCSAAEEVLERAAVCSNLSPVFIIVPDRFTLQAERILLSKKSCLFNVRVVTFSMLFNILYEESNTPSALLAATPLLRGDHVESNVLDKTSAVLFMWRAVQEVKKDLIWFNRSANHYAFAEKMFNTVNQLSSSMADFDKLEANARTEITRKKMHDIALIHGCYRRLIADQTDSSGVLGWLLENIGRSKIVKNAKIFVAGFRHLSIQRGAVVAELIKCAAEFTAGYQSGSEFEQLMAETALNLSLRCEKFDVKRAEKSMAPQLRAFGDVQEEAAWVANEICRLVKIDGVRFRDIVIVSADYQIAAKVFAQILGENGVAVNVDVGADLLGHPLTQYLKEYLLLAATGGQRHFLNIYKSAYGGLDADREFELENRALKSGQRGDENTARWIKKIQKCKTVHDFACVLAEILRFAQNDKDDSIAGRKLSELLETTARVSADQKMTVAEFINMFTALSAATKVSDIPALSDAVLLVAVTEYQPSCTPYVFVTGACDGAFPAVQDDTDIITAQDIANTAVRIEPSANLQNARNRLHAADILKSATQRLYVSFTNQNASEFVENIVPESAEAQVASKTYAKHLVLKAIGGGTAFEDVNFYGGVLHSLDLKGVEYFSPSPYKANLENAEQLFFPLQTARVTQIENFRKCPYYHFLENGLRVHPRERNIMAANIMGSVIHKLAEEFTREIITVGRSGLDGFDAEGEMKKVVERVLHIEEFRLMASDPKNAPVISNLKKEAKVLAREIVKTIRASNYFPAFAEMTVQGEIGGVTVRGKADRIDISKDNHAIIIDYKTGTVDRQSLQLPLYIGFLPKKFVADSAYYFSLKPGSLKMIAAAGCDGAVSAAGEIISQIKRGEIAPNPKSLNVCRYCVARLTCCRGGEHEEV